MDDNEVLQKIAHRLMVLRKGKGYSSYESFAFDHNIPRQQYWRMEKGENMTIKSLMRVLAAYNMTIEEFFAFDPNTKVS